jgi:DNA-binding NarL/FixJ family response regulator
VRELVLNISDPEKELFSHVLEGHSNEVIARHLRTTQADVKARLASLLRKINVENRTQATVWALANLPQVSKTLAFVSLCLLIMA